MSRNINKDSLKTALVKATGAFRVSGTLHDRALDELLIDVQRKNLYGDGKVFVDLIPKGRVKSIAQEYGLAKTDPLFDLREFVSRHFYDIADGLHQHRYESKPDHSQVEHINALWKVLERRNRLRRGSLLALPYPYIVPGGRFNEQFYWDSYFIMLGLATKGRWGMIEGMMKNFAFQLRKYGYIPTANRSYLLSRSQPPFFSHMVRLLAGHKGERSVLREYLPLLLIEYRFWMRGRSRITGTEYSAFDRVVEMPNGAILNRYYDNETVPRPESLREDMEAAERSGRADESRVYLHLRAAAESGWDFSSRWFTDPTDIHTVHTADIIPVDLNALLHHLELTIADAYGAALNPAGRQRFKKKAAARLQAINTYLWDEQAGFYQDVNFHKNEKTGVLSLAGVFPLYVGIASEDQARKVEQTLREDFLKMGGFVSTLIESGQQWDSPNGWAPLQWTTITGLQRYGYSALSCEARNRWLTLNDTIYRTQQKFVEKYNVEGEGGLGGGGEYRLQDGFGWTNGVYLALKEQQG